MWQDDAWDGAAHHPYTRPHGREAVPVPVRKLHRGLCPVRKPQGMWIPLSTCLVQTLTNTPQAHEILHVDKASFRCHICSDYFGPRSNRNVHVNRHLCGQGKMFACCLENCTKTYTELGNLRVSIIIIIRRVFPENNSAITSFANRLCRSTWTGSILRSWRCRLPALHLETSNTRISQPRSAICRNISRSSSGTSTKAEPFGHSDQLTET